MTRAEAAEDAAPAVPGPSRSESMQLAWRRLQHTRILPVTAAVVAALIVGLVVGRSSAPTVDTTAVATVQRDVVQLVVDADALWTAGGGGLPAVSDQLQQLRQTGSPETVTPHVEGWLEAYDSVLRRIIGVDVPPSARPAQRQFVAAVTLTRDAVELLAAAADVDDPATRRDLTSEVLRLRIRAEEFTQSAQASLSDLSGSTGGGVSEPRPLPSLPELR